MYDVTDGKWKKMFLGSPSQCIYSMVLGFFDPWYFIVHGIYLWFYVFYPFWERVGRNHNKFSSSLHLWEGIMMFWTIFSRNTIVKVKNEENMMYD